ncbi:amidophosphoribosyltransferase [Methanosphaera cuniculi]|uniref:amidophosphoribosyltransferase n=1 Tax=Methanosphaera cuniculi TaxID=1077256 RepID=UPI0026ECBA5E|nr:amidophosphoribosyltransferase [Methanosphaera cuniculi]
MKVQNDLQDKCGVIGVYSYDDSVDVASWILSGLHTIQHRGQESAGISVIKDGRTNTHVGMGLVSDVFDEDLIKLLNGNIGIGHVRYSTTGDSSHENCSPFVEEAEDINISIAHNGDIVNSFKLREELIEDGFKFKSNTDSEVICHLLIKEYQKSHDTVDAIKKTCDRLIGSYSLVIMINGILYAVRDPLGMKPLSLGGNDDFLVIASETVAFDSLNVDYIRSIKPGEILQIDGRDVESFFLKKYDHTANCMFEYLYFARPDSMIYDKSVYEVRLNVGKKLAEEYPIDADVVIAVPDSSIPATLAYSRATGIPYAEGLIKNRYVGRTFIMPTQQDRDIAVRLKMNTVDSIIKDKKVVVIDDSVVRGTTSKTIIKMLREAGAKEVHLLVGCPEIISPCYYGIAMATKEELLAVGRTNEEIRDEIGVDSIGYISIDGLVDAIGTPYEDLCLGCITGDYPTVIPEEIEDELN